MLSFGYCYQFCIVLKLSIRHTDSIASDLVDLLNVLENVDKIPDVQSRELAIHFMDEFGHFGSRIEPEKKDITEIFNFCQSFNVMLNNWNSGNQK